MFQLNTYGQADLSSVNEIYKSDTVPKKTSPHSIYASLAFGNNMVLASTVTTGQPYYYGSLIYGLSNDFFVSASTFHMPEFKSFITYSVLGLSYLHTFNSWFDISTGAYRFIVPKDLSDTLFSSFFYGDITFGVDWKLIYTQVSLSGILSDSDRGFLQVKNSRYFQTPEFFNNKAFISFDPYINLLMGSLTKTVTDGETIIGIDTPLRGKGRGNGSGDGSGTGPGSPPITQSTTFFGLMELDFGVPVGMNIGNVILEIEPGYVIPMYMDPEILSPEGFTIMISCFIKIF